MFRIYSQHYQWLALTLVLLSLGVSVDGDPLSLESALAEGKKQSKLIHYSEKEVSLETPEPDLDKFRSEIQPILEENCVRCHGPKKAKARLRIDKLDPNMLTGSDVDWWLEIQATLGQGEMPPPEESELRSEDRGKIMEWLSGEIRMASVIRRATADHSSFRRLTRYEYNYALQDILGLPWNFARDLPPEAHSEDGFQNSSDVLGMSVAQLETYRRIARKALERAIVIGPSPETLYWGVSMNKASRIDFSKQTQRIEKLKNDFQDKPEKLEKELARFKKPHRRAYFKDLRSGHTVEQSWGYGGARYALKPTLTRPEIPDTFDHVAIIPPGNPRNQRLIVELGEKVPDEGILRVRVRASAITDDENRYPSMQLMFGWQASNEGRALLRVSEEDVLVTASPDKPQIYEWNVPLGDIYPRNSVRKTSKLGRMPNPSEYIRIANSSDSMGIIQIDYVEVTTPVYDQWPPRSHQKIFFKSKNQESEPQYAREILTTFMHRAWRREISNDELDQKLNLFKVMRPLSDSFEEAMIEVLATVLSAPDFLYIINEGSSSDQGEKSEIQQLTDFELAARLSMFLWCSIPDEQLLDLAGSGSLSKPDILAGEVSRMLSDSKSKRFAHHFVHQWLDMQLLDFLNKDQGLDNALKEAMLKEPELLFQEALQNNQSALTFIHTDYTMVNERLARHYEIGGVYGNHFRRVSLNPDHRRGGLLTQAGLLAMNSSGEDSNPLKRGIWMLESLLNDPPPPPPPAVPVIDLADPEIAKMTLKERIEDHRNQPACMSCHIKIDPWGIAFENYGALGQWRDRVKGKPVDSTSRLFNNEKLEGMDGLKRFILLNRQDQFIRALTYKMVVYALGRPLSFADQNGIEVIAAKVRQEGDGMATMIQQIVTSEMFLTK